MATQTPAIRAFIVHCRPKEDGGAILDGLCRGLGVAPGSCEAGYSEQVRDSAGAFVDVTNLTVPPCLLVLHTGNPEWEALYQHVAGQYPVMLVSKGGARVQLRDPRDLAVDQPIDAMAKHLPAFVSEWAKKGYGHEAMGDSWLSVTEVPDLLVQTVESLTAMDILLQGYLLVRCPSLLRAAGLPLRSPTEKGEAETATERLWRTQGSMIGEADSFWLDPVLGAPCHLWRRDRVAEYVMRRVGIFLDRATQGFLRRCLCADECRAAGNVHLGNLQAGGSLETEPVGDTVGAMRLCWQFAQNGGFYQGKGPVVDARSFSEGQIVSLFGAAHEEFRALTEVLTFEYAR